MKRLILSLLLALAFLVPVKAQNLPVTPIVNQSVRVYAGISGSDDLDNLNAGVVAGIEKPFLNRYEVSASDDYSPYEQHVGLGNGHSNIAKVGGIIWFHGNTGFESGVEDSSYSVTDVRKSALYATGGLVYRTYFLSVPTRFSIGYAQQFNNGIDNGVETSHLRGAYLRMDGTPSVIGKVTVRIIEEFTIGHVLEQGNPVCDGSLGNGSQVGLSSCPRTGALGGGVDLKLVFQLNHKTADNELY